MLFLQPQHIIDLYCFVDNCIESKPSNSRGGRPLLLSDSEVLTILLWSSVVLHQKTLKEAYEMVCLYHRTDFPRMPKYRGFVTHCHRLIPLYYELLLSWLSTTAPIRIMDSTMLEVCAYQRSNTHQTARTIATYGKNHQGWHYGFKLHASIDRNGSLCGLALTQAHVHDAQVMPRILNAYTRVAVGDTTYGASVMGHLIHQAYGTIVIAPPHPKQRRKCMTRWQGLLLRARSKIESVFDYLKQHMHLVSSFPRSVEGYLLHYLRILLAYQLTHIFSIHATA